MKKVMLCCPPTNAFGGIATWAQHILTYYGSRNNLNIDLVFFPMFRKKFINASTPVLYRIKYGIEDYLQVLKIFKSSIKQKTPHIVHIATSGSFGLFRDILMQRITKQHNTKNIIHFHFGRIPELKKKKNWEWALLVYVIKKADVVIVLDMKSYRTLLDAGFTNVRLLANPLSEELVEMIEKYKDVYRIDRKIMFAGHLVPTKGVFELVKACINIPNIKLKIMGVSQPGIETVLLELAKQKGDIKWIEIIKNQSREIVIQEMLSAGVFVLPTYTEGFPNVILESMACGCPIVASAVGAIPEMLISDSNPAGICVPPKNINLLREAIKRMLNDKEFAQLCGENARIRVRSKYSMPVIWNQLTFIWEEVYNIKMDRK